jgi:hypothetical protein
LAEIKEYNRTKSSSTSTLFIDSTVTTPNVDELLRWWVPVHIHFQHETKFLILSYLFSTAISIAGHILRGVEATEKVYFDIFDERQNRLTVWLIFAFT